VNITATMEAPCPAEQLFAWVDDLGRYPSWLGIVERAEALPAGPGDPAWIVDLRGRVGPFARSKRLRMVRTEVQPSTRAVFERRETDGRRHAPWLLRAEVAPGAEDGSTLCMTLHYGGALWGPVLERLLADEIERGRARLLALVSAPRP
jgi:Polyketide cyclase / dehydrase and lipid transport